MFWVSNIKEVELLPVLPTTNAPTFDARTWRLRVDGLVRKKRDFDLREILSLPSVRFRDDFTCLEGWMVAGLVWRGVRVSELLHLVSAKAEAKCTLFSSRDYVQCLTIERCMEPTTILAYELNEASLPFEHGAPLRLISKGQECFESVKWVDKIHLTKDYRQSSARHIALNRIAQVKPAD